MIQLIRCKRGLAQCTGSHDELKNNKILLGNCMSPIIIANNKPSMKHKKNDIFNTMFSLLTSSNVSVESIINSHLKIQAVCHIQSKFVEFYHPFQVEEGLHIISVCAKRQLLKHRNCQIVPLKFFRFFFLVTRIIWSLIYQHKKLN